MYKKFQKQAERFLKDFNRFRDECNEKRISQGILEHSDIKYYLSVSKIDDYNYYISIEQTYIHINEFATLGYFLDLRDIQEAREKYRVSIQKMYRSKLFEN